MIKLISVLFFINLIYNPMSVQCNDVYTIIRFNDIWNDSYQYSTLSRYFYIKEKFVTLTTSFENVTDYTLQTMAWHYLKKGSVTHGVYITITKTNLYPRTNSVTAVKNAITNAYRDATILFAQEDSQSTSALQMYKINIICTFNQTWMDDYNNLTSSNSQLFINSVHTKIKSAFSQIYRLNLMFDKFASLRQGSVIANFTLYLNETTYSLYDYQIRDSINSVFEIAFEKNATIQIETIEPYVSSERSDVYSIIRFNDIWYDSYNYSIYSRYYYIVEKFNTLYTSFKNVTDYTLESMYWHYLKKGSVTHGVYITIRKANQFPTSSAVTAVKNAIMNAYRDATILFAQEDSKRTSALQMYKINIICTFNQTWMDDYNNLTSSNSQLFINSVHTKIKSAFSQIYRLNLMFVTFASLRQGSVIANFNLYLNETTYSLYDYQIRDSINSVFEIAFERNASIKIETIEPYVPPERSDTPTTPSTTPTPSITPTPSTTPIPSTTPTTSPTTTVTTSVISTKSGETVTQVNMKCSFNETYKKEYSDINSAEYNLYTKSIYDKLVEAFLKTILRILKIIFKSITEGSVLVDMEIVTASAKSVTPSEVTEIVKEKATEAFNNSMTILNIDAIPISTPPSTTSKTPENLPVDLIVGIVVGVIVLIVIVIIVVIIVVMKKRKKQQKKDTNKENNNKVQQENIYEVIIYENIYKADEEKDIYLNYEVGNKNPTNNGVNENRNINK